MRCSASSAGKVLPPAGAGEASEQLLHESASAHFGSAFLGRPQFGKMWWERRLLADQPPMARIETPAAVSSVQPFQTKPSGLRRQASSRRARIPS